METPFYGLIDRGDVFQVNPEFNEDIGWSIVVADKVWTWGIEAVLMEDLEALWSNSFRIKKRVDIGWEHLELLGHIRLGREYENTDFEKEGSVCNS